MIHIFLVLTQDYQKKLSLLTISLPVATTQLVTVQINAKIVKTKLVCKMGFFQIISVLEVRGHLDCNSLKNPCTGIKRQKNKTDMKQYGNGYETDTSFVL